MSARRYKKSYKILTFYKFKHGLVPPYRVLVDGTFCQAALENKINLREQIPKYLDAETEIVTTKCVLDELEKIGKVVGGARTVCKQFVIDKCPHRQPRSGRECFSHLAKKARKAGTKYIIATQDNILKEKLHKIRGTPCLFISWNAILFDKLSEELKEADEPKDPEIERLKELRKEILGETEIIRKKKKPKGQHPMSCKKKQVKPTQPSQRTGDRTANGKRRRKKKSAGQETTNETVSTGTEASQ